MNFIFDMDGLMFDTERICIKAWDYAGEKIGVGKAGYMVHKTLGMNIAAANKVWNEEFGDRYNEDELRKYTNDYMKKYYAENTVPVKYGLYELLDYLQDKNCKMMVASSSSRRQVEKHLKRAGVSNYLVENSKPAPDIYLKACEILGASPEDCLALEDSKNGLLAAYRAGCKPVIVPDLWQPDEEILQIIAARYDNLEQVKDAIANGEFISAKEDLK